MESEVDGILVAAHELKAPLAVLRQLALALGEISVDDEEIRTEMIKVSERAMRQVNDLAKMRRLEEGMFKMEPVAVREVCDAVTSELKYLFEAGERELLVKYTNRSRLVMANRELLRSVIYNFLINAVHYSNKNTRSQLSVFETKGKLRVAVRDFGPALPTGIFKELKTGQILKPTSIAMRPGSSGLGLYIASKFAQFMNAEIGAVRHQDGTSFYVNLPVSRQMSLF